MDENAHHFVFAFRKTGRPCTHKANDSNFIFPYFVLYSSITRKAKLSLPSFCLFFFNVLLCNAQCFRCSSPSDFVLFVLSCLLLLDYNLLPTILSSGGLLSFPLILFLWTVKTFENPKNATDCLLLSNCRRSYVCGQLLLLLAFLLPTTFVHVQTEDEPKEAFNLLFHTPYRLKINKPFLPPFLSFSPAAFIFPNAFSPRPSRPPKHRS